MTHPADRRTRRQVLSAGLGGLVTGAAMAACGDAESQAPAVHARKKVLWRMASSFPRGLDTIYGGAEVLAEQVNALSGGDFQVRVYPAGELVPGLQVMDAVQQGTIEAGQTASYYYTGKNPALAFDTCLPFGLTSRQQTAWLLEAGGLELVRRIFADFNIITFPAGNTGAQMGGWFRAPLTSVADLQGLKMRIPGVGGEVMSRLGVTVQVLAGGDIYPALERGAIDATEWVGPSDDLALGFHKVAKYYHYPGWWEPGPSLSFHVGTAAWGQLGAEHKAIFQAAAHVAATTMQARYDARNPGALATIEASGTQLVPFPADLMKAAEEAALALYEENAAQDAAYRQIYEHWKRSRTEQFRWWGTAELAYAQALFRR